MRTTAGHPAGLPEALMTAAGCAVEGTAWAALQVHHDSEGKLDQVGLFPMEHLSPACQRVARVLLLASLVPGDHPPQPDRTDILMQPLFPSFFSCVAEEGSTPVPAHRPDGPRIVEPRKVYDVRPAYPPRAREEGRQGVVILEAVISPTGCVRSVQVLHGSSPDLDAEALRTVTQWRYTPTLLNGVPVPVIMTVTVNFKLS